MTNASIPVPAVLPTAPPVLLAAGEAELVPDAPLDDVVLGLVLEPDGFELGLEEVVLQVVKGQSFADRSWEA